MKQPYFEEYLSVGDIPHYILHYPARKPECPVLLFLHGGPGSAESNFSYLFRQWWGEEMTLVQYDQRGSGKTLGRNPDYTAYPITKAALLDDLAVIVAHLKERYGKKKLVIVGHSWGTVLGAEYAQAHPEDVALYIAVGQVVDMVRNEQSGFDKALELAQKAGNAKDVRILESARPYPPADMSGKEGYRKLATVRKIQQKYNLAIRMPLSLMLAFMKSPSFKLSDLNIMLRKAPKASLPMLNELMRFDLNAHPLRFEMPVCSIQGDRDYQTVTPLAVAYFEKVEAPAKQIHVIEDAGHATMADQPERFAKALHQALTMIGADE